MYTLNVNGKIYFKICTKKTTMKHRCWFHIAMKGTLSSWNIPDVPRWQHIYKTSFLDKIKQHLDYTKMHSFKSIKYSN